MLLESGSRIGDYEILPSRQGGMGDVYLARDGWLGREVALKILQREDESGQGGDESRKLRFLREAKLASRLVHPNAAVIYETGNRDGVDFLVMKYVTGQPLNLRLAKGPLPIAELLELSGQIADVASAAHDLGIIHRDGSTIAPSSRNADRAREAIRRIEATAQQRYVSPHLLAFPYIGLGELDHALDCLERAAQDRSGWVVYLGVEPKLDPLRSQPRFQQLMKLPRAIHRLK